MEFPRIGLVRSMTDGSVLSTWDYPILDETGGGDVLNGPCPYLDYDPTQHEIISLTQYTREQYVMIANRHHETKVNHVGKDKLEFLHKGKDGEPDMPHEIEQKDKPHEDGPKDKVKQWGRKVLKRVLKEGKERIKPKAKR